jgi:hypothetical protein
MALDQTMERKPRPKTVTVGGLGQAWAWALIAGGVVLLSIVVHYVLALQQTAPWLMGDELRYADMAKSFLDERRLLFREEPISFATAYPALIAPAWSAATVATAYEAAKAINVVMMTFSAVVIFLWARRMMSVTYALVAGGLVLLMPTFVYTGMLMMENAALPAYLVAAYVIARALERPSVGWQLAVFAAIALAAAVRLQIATLAIVYPTAILLNAVFEWRAGSQRLLGSLRRFVMSFGIIVVCALAFVAYKMLSGATLASGLGAYATVGEVDYDLGQVARWTLWHAGELAFSVGFLPAVAFGVLLALAVGRGSLPTTAERAFVAVTAATGVWFVPQAAAFASRFTERIEERYMVYAAPLLLMSLVLWLARAAPKPVIGTSAALAVPALLVLTIPFARFFNVSIFGDSFGMVPLLRVSDHFGGGDDEVRLLVAIGLLVAAAAFVVLRPPLASVALPGAVAVFFVLSAYTVYGAIEIQSKGARGSSGVPEPSWVDEILGSDGEVGFIYSGSVSANPHLLWQTEFWNRSVRDVYALGADNALTFEGPEIAIDANGRLLPKAGTRPDTVDERYLLADPSLGIVGEEIARPGPLALIRIDPPARLGRAVDGVYPDRWSGPHAALTQYAPLPGGGRRLRVEVSRVGWGGPDVPGRVSISVGPVRMTDAGPTLARVTAIRQWTVHSGLTRSFDLAVPRGPFRVEVRITPTFSPAQFGQPDTRQLGAQLSFAPAPAWR